MAEKKKLAEEATVTEKVATEVKNNKPEPKYKTDQEKKELVLRLLWQCSRLVQGATKQELLYEMPVIREWVGVDRSEQLEKAWRAGKPQ